MTLPEPNVAVVDTRSIYNSLPKFEESWTEPVKNHEKIVNMVSNFGLPVVNSSERIIDWGVSILT